jgi:Flp pilus assembly protein TadG
LLEGLHALPEATQNMTEQKTKQPMGSHIWPSSERNAVCKTAFTWATQWAYKYLLATVMLLDHTEPFRGCTMALGLTQPLTDMSTSNVSWGVKAAGA